MDSDAKGGGGQAGVERRKESCSLTAAMRSSRLSKVVACADQGWPHEHEKEEKKPVHPHVRAVRQRFVRGSWSGAASCLHVHLMLHVPWPGMYSNCAQLQLLQCTSLACACCPMTLSVVCCSRWWRFLFGLVVARP